MLRSTASVPSGPAARTARDVIDDLTEALRVGGVGRGRPIPTGFKALDERLDGGLHPGRLHLVAGPPGVGKTTFALQAARTVVAAGGCALYVCMEHTSGELLERLVAMEAGLSAPYEAPGLSAVRALLRGRAKATRSTGECRARRLVRRAELGRAAVARRRRLRPDQRVGPRDAGCAGRRHPAGALHRLPAEGPRSRDGRPAGGQHRRGPQNAGPDPRHPGRGGLRDHLDRRTVRPSPHPAPGRPARAGLRVGRRPRAQQQVQRDLPQPSGLRDGEPGAVLRLGGLLHREEPGRHLRHRRRVRRPASTRPGSSPMGATSRRF